MVNCRDCKNCRVNTHVSPALIECSAVDGHLGCRNCKRFSLIAEWKWHKGNQIKCPHCEFPQTIPKPAEWRSGCCSQDVAAEVVVPFGGHRSKHSCEMFVAKAAEDPPARSPVTQPTLFGED